MLVFGKFCQCIKSMMILNKKRQEFDDHTKNDDEKDHRAVRNVNFSENFVYVRNEWFIRSCEKPKVTILYIYFLLA